MTPHNRIIEFAFWIVLAVVVVLGTIAAFR